MDGIDKRLVIVETRMTALETRMDDIDKRLVIVETSLKANNQYIARVLSQSKSGDTCKAVNPSRHLNLLINQAVNQSP